MQNPDWPCHDHAGSLEGSIDAPKSMRKSLIRFSFWISLDPLKREADLKLTYR